MLHNSRWFGFPFICLFDCLRVLLPHMILEILWERKSDIAQRAFCAAEIGLRMRIHVALKKPLFSKCLITKPTSERLWSVDQMRLFMVSQRVLRICLVIAMLALPRSRFWMCNCMFQNFALCHKLLFAEPTFEF